MIHALNGPLRSLPERAVCQKIADAINSGDQAIVEQFQDKGVILHLADWRANDDCYCIWCQDNVHRDSKEGTRFYEHQLKNDCIGTDKYLGILNPTDVGWRENS